MSRRTLSPFLFASALAAAAPAFADAPATEGASAKVPACCERLAKQMEGRGHDAPAAREDAAVEKQQGETPWWEQYPFVVPSDA